MDAALRELSKLEALTNGSTAKGVARTPSINASLDTLIQSLRNTHASIQAGAAPSDCLPQVVKEVESRKKDVDERQKEIYASLSRVGKSLDKKFTMSLPTFEPLFASEESEHALLRTIAIHFLRTGQFNTAETFEEECQAYIVPELKSQFIELYRILMALRNHDVGPALEWATAHRDFLNARSSSLEFHLRRSEYLFTLSQLGAAAAISYASANLNPFYAAHPSEVKALIACTAYLKDLKASPYAYLAEPGLHTDLEGEFAREYCSNLGMSRQVPLRVVGDIGGGGALMRIEKGRKVMRERKSEWSQADELPIGIPLSAENRYHSIFACPVSKEQTTYSNPPMMMACGHAIAKESLCKLSKPGGRVKCPYCPMESQMNTALSVSF